VGAAVSKRLLRTKSPDACALTSEGSDEPVPFIAFVDGILLWDCFDEAVLVLGDKPALSITGKFPVGYGLEHLTKNSTGVLVYVAELADEATAAPVINTKFYADVVEFAVAGGRYSALLGFSSWA